MQPIQDPLASKSSQYLFSPFSANSIKTHSLQGFGYGCAFYSQEHHMIIACPADNTIQFFDATTLLPLEERKSLRVSGVVNEISAQEKTDVLMIRSSSGFLYRFNIAAHTMEEISTDSEAHVLAVEFVKPALYAFSISQSNEVYIGSLENNDVLKFDSLHSDSLYLHHLPKSPLLLSSLDNGSVLIYRIDKLPKMSIIGRFQADREWEYVAFAQSFVMNGKEYVATMVQEKVIQIWHMVKGEMRLIRVIRTKDRICSFVYLENCKMIAVVYQSRYMEFFKVLSGKLEKRLALKITDAHSLFLMKDKNIIGATSFYRNIIEIVQLHPDSLVPCEERVF